MNYQPKSPLWDSVNLTCVPGAYVPGYLTLLIFYKTLIELSLSQGEVAKRRLLRSSMVRRHSASLGGMVGRNWTPLYDLQVQNKNRVENRYKKKRDNSCDDQSPDLGVTQRLP